MIPIDRAAATRRAVAALALVRLCEERDVELEQAGSSGWYVVTARNGSAMHVLAGEPDELLERVAAL